MESEHTATIPLPQLRGTATTGSWKLAWFSLLLTFVGILLPVVSAVVMIDVMHLWRTNHEWPYFVQFGITVVGCACTGTALALAWRARSLLLGRIAVALSGIATFLFVMLLGAVLQAVQNIDR